MPRVFLVSYNDPVTNLKVTKEIKDAAKANHILNVYNGKIKEASVEIDGSHISKHLLRGVAPKNNAILTELKTTTLRLIDGKLFQVFERVIRRTGQDPEYILVEKIPLPDWQKMRYDEREKFKKNLSW